MTMTAKARERAARMREIAVATARANAGQVNDIVDLIYSKWENGLSLDEAWEASKEEMIAGALARYADKIKAGLARAGIELNLEEGQPLTLVDIEQCIAERAGLPDLELTKDGIIEAMDGLMARKLSDELGIEIATVMNVESIKEAARAGLLLAIENGTAERLITQAYHITARKLATFRRAGYADKADQLRIMNNHYNKKYRQTHRQVWV